VNGGGLESALKRSIQWRYSRVREIAVKAKFGAGISHQFGDRID
jgi:hypothetical protein